MFRAPLPGTPDYIKRLIGLPGDKLEIREGVVYINGKKLDEPYRAAPPNPTDNYGPVTVPKGEYFMMGDNRDDSYDSRYWGFVPHDNIIGTPVMVYMSIDAPGEAWDPGHIRDRMTDVRERLCASGHRALAPHFQSVLMAALDSQRSGTPPGSSRHGKERVPSTSWITLKPV